MSKMKTAAIEAPTLFGDVRDSILDRLRGMKDPWPAMSEEAQREAIAGAEQLARRLIVESARLIAAHGFPTIVGKQVKVTVKDAMQMQIDISRHDPHRLTALDNVGRHVVLVIVEPDLFAGERRKPLTSLEEKLGLKPEDQKVARP